MIRGHSKFMQQLQSNSFAYYMCARASEEFVYEVSFVLFCIVSFESFYFVCTFFLHFAFHVSADVNE